MGLNQGWAPSRNCSFSGNVFSSKFYFSSQNVLLKGRKTFSKNIKTMFIDNIVRTLSSNIIIKLPITLDVDLHCSEVKFSLKVKTQPLFDVKLQHHYITPKTALSASLIINQIDFISVIHL